MPREFMCQYGNCNETKVTITVTDKDGMERARYCCREHAALGLLYRAWQYDRIPPDRVVENIRAAMRQ